MAKSYEVLKNEISAITNEVEDGANTANRIGGAMADIADFAKESLEAQEERINEETDTKISELVVQETGDGEGVVMSQKAVSGKLGEILPQVVFDISEYNKVDDVPATYADLNEALGGIPQSVQKGGISIRFIQTSDNKYIQARLMANAFTTNVARWQVVDDEPIPNSKNLVESGGVDAITNVLGRNAITTLNSGYILFSNGSIHDTENQVYRYSNNIEVQEGQVYAICCKEGSATPAAVAAYDSNNTYIQGWSVNFNDYFDLKRFLYVVPEGVHHIVITGHLTETISAIQLSNDILQGLGYVLIPDKIKLSRSSYGIYSSNGEPYTNVQDVSSTPDIEVSKDDIFYIEAGDFSSTCVVAAYDASNNYIKKHSIIGTGQTISVNYRVPDGVNKIVICNNDAINGTPIVIKKSNMLSYYDNSLIDLSSRIDNILPMVPIAIHNLNSGWIAWSDGIVNSGGTNYYSDPILVSEGDMFEYNGGASSPVAVVAMYTSTSATSNDYVQLSSIAGTGEGNNIEFTIPHGIVAIRLCNNTELVSFENLLLYKRNPLYFDFTTPEDVETIVSNNIFAPISRDRIRISPTRKAVFSFIFDDLWASDKAVFDIFQNYGFFPSYALSYENITESNIKLYKDMYIKGCSILGHGGPADANTIKQAYKTLTELGFVINGFVTPQSVLPDNLKPLAASIYGYCFTESPNDQSVLPSTTTGKYDENASRFNLARIGLESWNMDADPSLVYLKDCVDDAIANNLFIVFYGHQIPSSYKNTDGVTSRFTVEDLGNLLQYIKTKVDDCQCVVLPTDEAVAYYYNMVNPT